MDLIGQMTELVNELEMLGVRARPFEARRRLHQAPAFVHHHALRRLPWLKSVTASRPGVAWFPVTYRLREPPLPGGLVSVKVSEDMTLVSPSQSPCPPMPPAVQWGAQAAGVEAPRLRVSFGPEPQVGALIDGRSYELALALATWSFLTDTPLPTQTAWTGWWEGERLVAPVAPCLVDKLEAVKGEWGTAGRLGTGPAIEWGALVSRPSLSAWIGAVSATPLPPEPLRAALRGLANDMANGRGQSAQARVTRLLAEEGEKVLSAQEKASVVAAAVQLANHRGASDEALALAARPETRVALPGDKALIAAGVAIACIDRGEPARAMETLTEALAAGAYGTLGGDLEQTRLLGSLARALSAAGRHDEAIARGDEAMAVAPPVERPRNLADAGLWRLRAGRPAEALPVLAKAQQEAQTLMPHAPELGLTLQYIELFQARAHLALGDDTRGRALWARGPGPDLSLVLGWLALGARLGVPLDGPLTDFEIRYAELLKLGIVQRYRELIDSLRFGRPRADLERLVPY